MIKKLMSRFQASLEDAHSRLGAHEDKHEFREPFWLKMVANKKLSSSFHGRFLIWKKKKQS